MVGAAEKKISDILFLTRESLRVAGIDDFAQEAAYLVAHYAQCKPMELNLKGDDYLTEDQFRDLSYAIRRRFTHEPPQYITGEQEFYGYTFKVVPGVLIPRPETELIVDEVVRIMEAAANPAAKVPLIIDLCTGSGALAITLAREIARVRVVASDISETALKTARENAKDLDVMERVRFLEGDLFEPYALYEPDEVFVEDLGLSSNVAGILASSADIIVSNPPYVTIAEFEGLQKEIKDFEPKEALVGGVDGLDVIKRIVDDAPGYLKPGGYLIIEMGFAQAGPVTRYIDATGHYSDILVVPDLAGIERVVEARLATAS